MICFFVVDRAVDVSIMLVKLLRALSMSVSVFSRRLRLVSFSM